MLCLTSVLYTLASTVISTFNYPGAHALLRLNSILRSEGATPGNTTIHLNAYSRMNGISDMAHDETISRVSKDETLQDPGQYTVFDYIITHEPELYTRAFDPIQTIRGWAGFKVQLPRLLKAARQGEIDYFLPRSKEGLSTYLSRIFPVQPRLDELVWIMENRKRRKLSA
jgi:hypothetical protein